MNRADKLNIRLIRNKTNIMNREKVRDLIISVITDSDKLTNVVDVLMELMTPKNQIHVTELDEGYALAIGIKAPWDCDQIEVSEEVAKQVLKILNK